MSSTERNFLILLFIIAVLIFALVFFLTKKEEKIQTNIESSDFLLEKLTPQEYKIPTQEEVEERDALLKNLTPKKESFNPKEEQETLKLLDRLTPKQ